MSHVACRMSFVLRKRSCSLMNSCLFDFLALSLFSHVDMLKKPNDEVICSARLRRFNRNTGSYSCGSKMEWDMDFFQARASVQPDEEGRQYTHHQHYARISVGHQTHRPKRFICFFLVLRVVCADTCDRRRRDAHKPVSFPPLPVTPVKIFSKPSKYGRPSVDGQSRKFLSEKPRAVQ